MTRKPRRSQGPTPARARARATDPTTLSGLGPACGRWLTAVDIRSVAELRRVGAVEAYGRVRFNIGREATRNLLYALEAALREVHWTEITQADKERLCLAAGIAPPTTRPARRR